MTALPPSDRAAQGGGELLHRITYRLETNDLPTDRAEMVRRACDRVTQRKVRRDGRLLVFEAVDNLAHFQGPGS